MGDMNFKIHHVKGSEALAFLAGMAELNTDIVYPTVLFQRSMNITDVVLADSQDRKILGDWEFWVDGVFSRVEPLRADLRSPSQFVWINVKESGNGRLLFNDDTPVSLISGAAGAAVAGAVVPAENYNGISGRTFKVPYIYRAGSTISFKWISDGNLAAGARICETMLTGYMVRKGLVIVDQG